MKGAENLIRTFNPIIIFEYNGFVTENFLEYERFLEGINYNYKRVDNWNWVATKNV